MEGPLFDLREVQGAPFSGFEGGSWFALSKPWSISFGVQHERGFGAIPVPSGTQLVIRGDLELLKLIAPGAAK